MLATFSASGSGALSMDAGRNRLDTHDHPPCTGGSCSSPGLEWSCGTSVSSGAMWTRSSEWQDDQIWLWSVGVVSDFGCGGQGQVVCVGAISAPRNILVTWPKTQLHCTRSTTIM